jgi:hypothetical protein
MGWQHIITQADARQSAGRSRPPSFDCVLMQLIGLDVFIATPKGAERDGLALLQLDWDATFPLRCA